MYVLANCKYTMYAQDVVFHTSVYALSPNFPPLSQCSHTLCDLAHVCAEVCCNVGPLVNKELMGAFRALCLPMTMMKSCMTGFNHLTSKSNVSQNCWKHLLP